MTRMGYAVLKGFLLAIVLALPAQTAWAQGPTIEPGTPSAPGGGDSRLGPSPGEVGGPRGDSPGQEGGVLGGRPGPSVPRVPPSVTRPGGTFLPERRGIALPEALPIAEVPLYGPLALPAGAEDEGPPNGLTLDAAIERLMQANLNLRAQAMEIPQAQADILTASLRANPVFYADAQLVPYGGFPKDRPGGPTQYDVNISYPLDVTRKRRARTAVASQAKRVIEAQFQDAVRLQIENLYTAYVDVLAARETVRFARTSLTGLGKLLQLAETQKEKEFSTQAEVNRVKILRDAAEIGVQESEKRAPASQADPRRPPEGSPRPGRCLRTPGNHSGRLTPAPARGGTHRPRPSEPPGPCRLSARRRTGCGGGEACPCQSALRRLPPLPAVHLAG